jgi:hypothetical protein
MRSVFILCVTYYERCFEAMGVGIFPNALVGCWAHRAAPERLLGANPVSGHESSDRELRMFVFLSWYHLKQELT